MKNAARSLACAGRVADGFVLSGGGAGSPRAESLSVCTIDGGSESRPRTPSLLAVGYPWTESVWLLGASRTRVTRSPRRPRRGLCYFPVQRPGSAGRSRRWRILSVRWWLSGAKRALELGPELGLCAGARDVWVSYPVVIALGKRPGAPGGRWALGVSTGWRRTSPDLTLSRHAKVSFPAESGGRVVVAVETARPWARAGRCGRYER